MFAALLCARGYSGLLVEAPAHIKSSDHAVQHPGASKHTRKSFGTFNTMKCTYTLAPQIWAACMLCRHVMHVKVHSSGMLGLEVLFYCKVFPAPGCPAQHTVLVLTIRMVYETVHTT